MSRKNISQEKIIQSFLASAFEKSAGATSLADISHSLEIKKASLYNHFESKENMYSSTLELCGKEINLVSFLSDKTIDSIKNGKTTLLSEIIYSTIINHNSDEVNIYIMDFASMVLKNFENLNHVGGVVTSSEDEKSKNLLKRI